MRNKEGPDPADYADAKKDPRLYCFHMRKEYHIQPNRPTPENANYETLRLWLSVIYHLIAIDKTRKS